MYWFFLHTFALRPSLKMHVSLVGFRVLCKLVFLTVVVDSRFILRSHANPSEVKHFESKLDERTGYWSPSTSSIDWCERNYVITEYIAEFWNCLSSFVMCIFAGILLIRGYYYGIENRFLLLSLSFGLVGFGSAYFHGTLTHLGQMTDELPMVYSMIVWWFILFRMDSLSKLKTKISSLDVFILFGIFYGLLWTYVHSLQTFILVFQLHFTLMVVGGILRLIYLYHKIQYHTRSILYLVMVYVGLLMPATICWIIDQQLCERFNSKDSFNPQLHAWWHVFCAVDCHVGIVCGEAMRYLSIKYKQDQMNERKSFQPEEHLRIVFHFGLPFVDYSTDEQIKQIKNK